MPFQQAAAAYTCKRGRDLVLHMRVAVNQSITLRRRMVRVGAPMYDLWLAQTSPKTVEARRSRQNQVCLAFLIQKRERCDAGQSHGSWLVIGFWFLNVPFFGTNVTGYTWSWRKRFYSHFHITYPGMFTVYLRLFVFLRLCRSHHLCLCEWSQVEEVRHTCHTAQRVRPHSCITIFISYLLYRWSPGTSTYFIFSYLYSALYEQLVPAWNSTSSLHFSRAINSNITTKLHNVVPGCGGTSLTRKKETARQGFG